MSLTTWKDSYYSPVFQHSLKKWQGVVKVSLKKHGYENLEQALSKALKDEKRKK